MLSFVPRCSTPLVLFDNLQQFRCETFGDCTSMLLRQAQQAVALATRRSNALPVPRLVPVKRQSGLWCRRAATSADQDSLVKPRYDIKMLYDGQASPNRPRMIMFLSLRISFILYACSCACDCCQAICVTDAGWGHSQTCSAVQ